MTLHHRQLGLALLASMLLHGVLLSEIHFRVPAAVATSQPLFVDFGPITTGPSPGPPADASQEAPAVASRRVLRPSHAPASPAPGKEQKRSSHSGKAPFTSVLPPDGATTPEDLRSRSLQMARRETTDPFAGQRLRALSPQTRDSVFGPYEEAYRQKVEQVGRVNYPPPVDGRPLYGMVRITATIRQDGSLALIEIRQPSGSPNLDDAARRIIQMAAPFQPFTEAMRAQADLVSITRSFNFVRAGEAISIK